MSFDFLDRRRAERFAEYLDGPSGGRRPSHGQPDESLAELVAVAAAVTAAKPEIQVDSEFRDGLRAMLVATVERDGIGSDLASATSTTMAPAGAGYSTPSWGAGDRAPAGSGSGMPPADADGRRGLRGLLLGGGGRRTRARGAIVIGVAAGALAVSGISAASENASPGDALYGVKRSTERAQLAMAGSDVSRGQLSLDFARTRLAEAAAMPGDATDFAGVLDDMDASTRRGVRLLDTSAVARRDIKPLATVDDFADRQRRTLAPVLGRLSPANQERAAASLALLDAVTRRTGDLRSGLSCPTVQPAGADTLGPKLRECATTTQGADTSTRPSGSNGKATTRDPRDAKVKPERAGPSAKPSTTTDVADPDAPAQSPAPALPLGGTPLVSPSPDAGTGTDDDGDTVGGLLGELFGFH
ncbi:DUF5667 domain-containing protein [Paractinoplanes rhizophilus]|uniref:DUF5667 domain-containing protein n=1 Tax=Paractinoplanes rhizophilus TaxID=1416877 RepID=A0ABW2HR65_9ACTN|nr:DUF5667 domain-containing protein [Actinoplanes sp.]